MYFENIENIPKSLSNNQNFINRVNINHPIRLNVYDKIKIIFAALYVLFCKTFCCKKFEKTYQVINPRIGRLYKIFKNGKKKIDSDLNILNVLNRLRLFQTIIFDNMTKE